MPLAEDALRILAKYPPIPDELPDEPDLPLFPKISNQKFNAHMKEVGKLAGLTGDWIIETQNGRTQTRKTVKKYEVLASHCGRRTFATLYLRKRHVSRGYTCRDRTHQCRNDDEVCQV